MRAFSDHGLTPAAFHRFDPAGTGFRCVAILEMLEQDLRRPVISANQASLWHCLRLSGVKTPVSEYGGLLRL